MTVKVEGLASTMARLSADSAKVKAVANRVIRKYALKIERTAKRLAPVDTGRLRSSIRTELEDLAATILTDVHYAPFQELGTGRRGATSGIDPPPGYNYGPSAGISPNSFLRPAFERHRAAFVRELKTSVRKVL